MSFQKMYQMCLFPGVLASHIPDSSSLTSPDDAPADCQALKNQHLQAAEQADQYQEPEHSHNPHNG